jgi:hypothetical protein
MQIDVETEGPVIVARKPLAKALGEQSILDGRLEVGL